jgi:hypothetical protein
MLMRSMSIAFLFVFFLFSPTIYAAEDNEKDWLIYFDSTHHMSQFLERYPSTIFDTENRIVSFSASLSFIDKVEQLPFVKDVEPNYTKSATAQTAPYNDPLFSQQWALSKVDALHTLKRYRDKQVNALKGTQLTLEPSGQKMTYQEQPFTTSHFTLSGKERPLSRISVTLMNTHSLWSIEVYDEHNQLIGQNKGDLPTLDVLVPKNRMYTVLRMKLITDEKWTSPPTIKRVTGVNHARVAVVDSGVIPHEDFCDNLLISLGKDYREKLPYARDQFGHGTHVTGILAACGHNQKGMTGIIGNAPIDIIPLKVLDEFGNGTDFEISQAVEDATKMDVDVINMSLAGKGETTVLREAVMNAFKKNILIVASAGNQHVPTDHIYPASYPGVLTVTGTEQTNVPIAIANYGWAVDLSAPGASILSTHLNNQYKAMRGTSMATPFVSGAAALLKVTYPHLDAITTRQHLLHTAVDIKDRGYDQWTGRGIIQVDKVLSQKPPTHAAEWVNLKPNQPLRKGGSYLLGTSPSLLQKDALLFVNESLVERRIIEDSLQLFTFPVVQSSQKKVDVHTLFVDQSKRILSTTHFPVQHHQVQATRTLKDVPPSFWGYEEIKKAHEAELINGYEDGTFRPMESITRRHSLMMLNRLFQWPLPSALELPFEDITIKTPGFISILSTYHQGIVTGYGQEFRPEQRLTRAQMAMLLARSLQVNVNQSLAVHTFRDVPPSHDAYHAIQQLVKLNIITKQDMFRPNASLTRAQFCAMLIRAQQHIAAQPS